MSKSIVQSIEKVYLDSKKRRVDDHERIRSLPVKKCGRPLLLGEDLDVIGENIFEKSGREVVW